MAVIGPSGFGGGGSDSGGDSGGGSSDSTPDPVESDVSASSPSGTVQPSGTDNPFNNELNGGEVVSDTYVSEIPEETDSGSSVDDSVDSGDNETMVSGPVQPTGVQNPFNLSIDDGEITGVSEDYVTEGGNVPGLENVLSSEQVDTIESRIQAGVTPEDSFTRGTPTTTEEVADAGRDTVRAFRAGESGLSLKLIAVGAAALLLVPALFGGD